MENESELSEQKCFDGETYTQIFFYKHHAYKHIQAEILHFFKHNAKHIPASDFGYILVYWYIGIYI